MSGLQCKDDPGHEVDTANKAEGTLSGFASLVRPKVTEV